MHSRQIVCPSISVVDSSGHSAQLVLRPSSALKESMAQGLQSELNVAPTVLDHFPGEHFKLEDRKNKKKHYYQQIR